MGSAISRTSGAASKIRTRPRGDQTENVKKAQQVVRRTDEANTISKPPSNGPMRNNTSGSTFDERSEKWANILNNLSTSIKTSSWEEEEQRSQYEEGGHPAQRSKEYAEKLPSKPRRDAVGRGSSKEGEQRAIGRLTQNQVLALFSLRRRDSESWTTGKIAERFGIDGEDARNILSFTRTYTGRRDEDDLLRGYYKCDEDDTIQRFERD